MNFDWCALFSFWKERIIKRYNKNVIYRRVLLDKKRNTLVLDRDQLLTMLNPYKPARVYICWSKTIRLIEKIVESKKHFRLLGQIFYEIQNKNFLESSQDQDVIKETFLRELSKINPILIRKLQWKTITILHEWIINHPDLSTIL